MLNVRRESCRGRRARVRVVFMAVQMARGVESVGLKYIGCLSLVVVVVVAVVVVV